MPPIFIVGPARSGTELARSILNRHPAVYINVETHWFEDMRPRLERAGPSSAASIEAAAFLTGLRRRSYGLSNDTGSEQEITDLLAEAASVTTSGSTDALFEAFCHVEARKQGCATWGEKTPRHVFSIDRILSSFPDARIVACIRDPRGAVASYRDWRNHWFDGKNVDNDLAVAIATEEKRTQKSYSLTICSLLWRSAVTQARHAIDRYGTDRVYALRFEDLLHDPDREIQALTTWLGLEAHPDLAQVTVTNSSYVAAGTMKGLHAAVAENWRSRLSSREIEWIEMLTGSAMADWRYQRESKRPRVTTFCLNVSRLPYEIMKAFIANRSRISDLPRYISSRIAGLVMSFPKTPRA